MKLRKVTIKDYRILHDFSIEFNNKDDTQGYAIDLIVGVNGTGKSTLLRLLASIFQQLEKGNATIPFGFAVCYQLAGDSSPLIYISNLSYDETEIRQDKRVVFRRGENVNAPAEVVDSIDTNYLPLVVAFTTGSEKDWELSGFSGEENDNLNWENQKFIDPQALAFKEQLIEWYLHELPGELIKEVTDEKTVSQTSKFLFIIADDIPQLILCGLLADMKVLEAELPDIPNGKRWNRLEKVMDASRIKALRGFSLKFRMNRDNLAEDQRALMVKLMGLAHHTIQTGSDYLMVFELATTASKKPGAIYPQEFIELAGNRLELFRTLVRWKKPDQIGDPILQKTYLFLERQAEKRPGLEDQDEKLPLHLLDWMSDGEQSFLGRMCLLSLLGGEEALILLDEPEVHFNDYWKRQLIYTIDQALKEQASHILMTTHSSITLSDVGNTDIWILQRNGHYTGAAYPPGMKTLGADPSDIIISVFGAENATGAQSVNYIEQTVKDIRDSKEDSRIKIENLGDLLQKVGPGYWSYLIRREIHELEGLK